ncbi:hypothetical protein ABPG74_007446 [Tetrahymena malaccensis]
MSRYILYLNLSAIFILSILKTTHGQLLTQILNQINSIAYLNQNTFVVCLDQNKIQAWSITTKQKIAGINGSQCSQVVRINDSRFASGSSQSITCKQLFIMNISRIIIVLVFSFQDNQINKISPTLDFIGLTYLQVLNDQYVVASSNSEMRIYDINLQKYESFSCSKPDQGLFFNPNDDLMISSCEGQITSNTWDKQLKTPALEQYQQVTKHGYTSPILNIQSLLVNILIINNNIIYKLQYIDTKISFSQQLQVNSLVKYSVVGQKIVVLDQNSLSIFYDDLSLDEKIDQNFLGFDYLRYSENLILYDQQNKVYLINHKNSFQWCNDSCLTCDAGDPNLCLICRFSNMIVNQNSQCVCKDGFFLDSNLLCQKCDPTCKTCKDQNSCLTCEETLFRVYNSNTSQCDCQQSYYQQNSSPTCIKCPYQCQTCAFDNTLNIVKCLQCYQNTQLNRNNTGNCECKSGFYEDGTNLKCLQCNYTCQECTSSNKCSSCNNSKYRQLNSSTSSCVCQSGYYDDGDNQLCQKCPYYCLECQKQGNKIICTSCNTNGSNRQNDQTCSCQQGYYDYGQAVCKQCNNGCDSCDQNGQCQANCPQNCIFCTSSTQCTKCKALTYLVNQQCLTQCKSDQYANDLKQTCDPCPANCSKCNLNGQKCQQCNPDYVLYQGNCLTICPDGFYKDQNNFCQQCQSNCNLCNSNGICNKCKDGFYLYLDKLCLVNCPDGSYKDVNNKCQKCQQNCLKCDSQSTCSKCQDNFYLYQNSQCLTQCPEANYKDSNNVCQQCLQNCKQCDTLNVCNQCLEGFVLYQNNQCLLNCPKGSYKDSTNVCRQCQKNCAQCNSTDICNQCLDNFYLFQNKYCLQVCPEGFFKNQSICQQCTPNCSKCDQINTCNKCLDGYYLYQNRNCLAICPDGSYKNTDKICQLCQSNCQQCDSNEVCNKCQDGFYLFQKQKCLDNCPEGNYKDSNKTCQLCQPNCEQCDSNESCNKCLDGFYLFQKKQCLDNCPKGSYKDSNNTCQLCQQNCIQCNSTGVCSQCQDGFFLHQNQNCLKICPNNYYPDFQSRKCEKCMTNCDQCSSSDTCDYCEQNFYLLNNNKCLSECPQEYFKYSSTKNICGSCLLNCIKCSSFSSCQKCGNGFYLLDGLQCVQKCPEGYFESPSEGTCQLCSTDFCQKCNQQNKCFECKINYLLKETECVQQCGQGFQIQNNTCITCKAKNCLQCNISIDQCSSCQEGFELYKNQCFAKCQSKQLRDENGKCFEQNLFKLEQKSDNQIKLIFNTKPHSEDIKKELQISVKNLEGQFDYTVDIQDDLTLIIKITTFKKLQDKQTVTVKINNNNHEFAYDEQSIDIQLNQQKQDENPVASQSIETATQAVSSATIAAIFPLAVSGNFWMISSILDISQIIYMTSFIEFRMSSTLETFLSSQKNFKIPFPNFFEYIDHYEDIVYQTPSQIFEKDIQGFYLSNMGDTISLLAIILGLNLSLKIFKILLSKCEKVQKIIIKLENKLFPSTLLVDLLWIVYQDMSFSVVLQLIALTTARYAVEVLNYFFFSISALGIGLPLYLSYLIYNGFNNEIKEHLTKDQNFNYYQIILYFRKFFYTVVIGAIQSSPITQILLITIFYCICFLIIIKVKPFKERFLNIKEGIQCLSFFFCHILILALYIIDESKSMSYKIICWVVLSLFSLIITFEVILCVKEIYLAIKEVYNKCKSNKKKKLNIIIPYNEKQVIKKQDQQILDELQSIPHKEFQSSIQDQNMESDLSPTKLENRQFISQFMDQNQIKAKYELNSPRRLKRKRKNKTSFIQMYTKTQLPDVQSISNMIKYNQSQSEISVEGQTFRGFRLPNTQRSTSVLIEDQDKKSYNNSIVMIKNEIKQIYKNKSDVIEE